MRPNKLSVLAAVCSVVVVGCGSSNESQMMSAIQETLDAVAEKKSTDGAACLPLPLAENVRESEGKPVPVFAKSEADAASLQALVARGLLQQEAPGPRGAQRLGLTQEGMKYLRFERTSHFAWAWHWALCTGAMKVDKIESYTKPTDLLGQTITSVNYRYTIQGAADWAKDAQLQALSPRLARDFQKPVSRMDLVQTNKGWRSIYMQQRQAGLVK